MPTQAGVKKAALFGAPLFYLTVFCILLRLPNFGESLWLDELLYATSVSLKNLGSLFVFTLTDSALPFYRIFMFFWVRLFGESALSVRTPSLIFGILSMLLTYAIALKLTERKIALLASFLLCVSPAHIWYSQEATPYSMLLFLFLAAIFSYYKIRESKTGLLWYCSYFFSLFLAVFTQICASVYLVLFSIMSLVKTDKAKQGVLMLNFLILAGFVLFAAVKIAFGNFPTDSYHLRPFGFFEFWMLFFNWFLFGNSIWNMLPYEANTQVILARPSMLASQAFFLFIFIYGLLVSFQKKRNPYGADAALYLFSLPLFFSGLNLFGFRHIYKERYLFMVLPFFYMILANGVSGFRIKPVRFASSGIVVIFSIAALAGFLKKPDEWTVYSPNPDWRSLVQYFEGERKSVKPPIMVYAMSPPRPLQYYGTRLAKWDLQSPFKIYPCNRDNADSLYGKLSENNTEIFYFMAEKNRIWNVDGLFKDVSNDPRFRLLAAPSFKGLEVFKFRVSPACARRLS